MYRVNVYYYKKNNTLGEVVIKDIAKVVKAFKMVRRYQKCNRYHSSEIRNLPTNNTVFEDFA